MAMSWTPEQKVAALMRLPWSVRTTQESEHAWYARVAELPSVLASGENPKALGRDFWDALESTLAAYVEHGDPIPVPDGSTLPWDIGQDPPTEPRIVYAHLDGAAWDRTPSASASTKVLALQ